MNHADCRATQAAITPTNTHALQQPVPARTIAAAIAQFRCTDP